MTSETIGTDTKTIYNHQTGKVLDFFIQNVSANKVYFLESTSQSTADGIELIPSASIAKDNWMYDVILVADGAASDVRFIKQVKKEGMP